MSHSQLAPVAVFAYRRTSHLSQTLDALERCPEFAASPVYVFSDGPKSEAAAVDIASVRALIRARLRPNMTLVEAPANKGLAASISGAATQLCEAYGRVIIIEDDLIVSPCTLAWFNAGLDRFRDAEQVYQISAHQFDVPAFASRRDGMFLHLTTSWGWATWKRAWDHYDPEATGWERLKQDTALRRRFDVGGYPYFDMLRRQMEGQIDSWAIRWWWTVFNAGGISLYPPRSLVTNIGFDETATHLKLGWLRRKKNTSGIPMEAVSPSLPADATAKPEDDALLRASIAGRSKGLANFAMSQLANLRSALKASL